MPAADLPMPSHVFLVPDEFRPMLTDVALSLTKSGQIWPDGFGTNWIKFGSRLPKSGRNRPLYLSIGAKLDQMLAKPVTVRAELDPILTNFD